MRLGLAVLCIMALAASASAAQVCQTQAVFAVAAHGGEFNHPLKEAPPLGVIKAALEKARGELKAGARSIDVVEEIVRTFEDSGAFNAGRGAVADQAGLVETDAAIMDGDGQRAGAVASMTRLKNPIVAARLVMDADRHVLMAGDRGQDYVVKLGAVAVPASYFIYSGKVTRKPVAMHDKHGTVGAVALDRCGHLAAATSTGGYDAKVPGRVGDSPLVGDGVYAADGVVALSGTGWGEYYIRYNVSKDVADRMRYGHQTLAAAMKADLFDVLKPLKADGGLIGVDAKGNVAVLYNAVGMLRGYATDREAPVVADYAGPSESAPRGK
ncbi:MAG: isoaspartyl peptidase/L-asparaginase [Alphaproteobacteria bacterium]|nr:isoaspartyl peptidase/L-asparaginase [Alphaproteobacteria bacterium]